MRRVCSMWAEKNAVLSFNTLVAVMFAPRHPESFGQHEVGDTDLSNCLKRPSPRNSRPQIGSGGEFFTARLRHRAHSWKSARNLTVNLQFVLQPISEFRSSRVGCECFQAAALANQPATQRRRSVRAFTRASSTNFPFLSVRKLDC